MMLPIVTLTKSSVDKSLNGMEKDATLIPQKLSDKVEFQEKNYIAEKINKIDYGKYGRTKVRCKVIQFEIKSDSE